LAGLVPADVRDTCTEGKADTNSGEFAALDCSASASSGPATVGYFAYLTAGQMQAAFDAKWEAGVPFTMVIAPGGKVIYQKQGEVDTLDLRRIILANLPDPDYIGHRAYWASK
jgi:hypothetical protein